MDILDLLSQKQPIWTQQCSIKTIDGLSTATPTGFWRFQIIWANWKTCGSVLVWKRLNDCGREGLTTLLVKKPCRKKRLWSTFSSSFICPKAQCEEESPDITSKLLWFFCSYRAGCFVKFFGISSWWLGMLQQSNYLVAWGKSGLLPGLGYGGHVHIETFFRRCNPYEISNIHT